MVTIGDMFGGTTTHRLVPRNGPEHRDAVFPIGAQATIAIGVLDVTTRDVRLSSPAFDLTSWLEELTEDKEKRTVRVTLVTDVANDHDRVEIVEGVPRGISYSAESDEAYSVGNTTVEFDDGTFVYLYGVLSLRVEL